MFKKVTLIIVLLLLPINQLYAQNGNHKMKIKMIIGNQFMVATLDNTPVAQDFMALLPMTLELSDYNSTEKVADLPKKLITNSAPKGYTPLKGDISYYAPWGNLAIFYKNFGYSNGLVKIGTIDRNIELLDQSVPFSVRFEKFE